MFSRILFQLDKKRKKLITIMVSIEYENNCFLSKVFDRNPRFPKKKKNADISFNKLLISEKCEY